MLLYMNIVFKILILLYFFYLLSNWKNNFYKIEELYIFFNLLQYS